MNLNTRRSGDPTRYQVCRSLRWHSVTLQADGAVAACCNVYDPADDFGHLDRKSVRGIRLDRRWREARSLFTERDAGDLRIADADPAFMAILRDERAHAKTWAGMR